MFIGHTLAPQIEGIDRLPYGLATQPDPIGTTTVPLCPLEILKTEEARSHLYQALVEKTSREVQGVEYLKSQFEFNDEAEVTSLYSNIPCPRKTAVEVDGKFIHANYVKDEIQSRVFVASQSPNDYSLFWKVIFYGDYEIIDLTEEESYYSPMSDKMPIVFDDLKIQLIEKRDDSPEERTYVFDVHDAKSQTTKRIRRCHYFAWKDSCGVELPALHHLVEKLETSFQGGVLIHCLAGVGRTGTLITAYFLKQRILQGMIKPEDLGTSLVDLLVQLRLQRGKSFVHKKAQFLLLIDFAIDVMKRARK